LAVNQRLSALACHPRGTKLDALALHRRYFTVREPNYLAARCALLHPASDKPSIDLFDLVSVPLADGTSRLQTLIQSRLRGTQPRFAATPPKAQESARHSTMKKRVLCYSEFLGISCCRRRLSRKWNSRPASREIRRWPEEAAGSDVATAARRRAL